MYKWRKDVAQWEIGKTLYLSIPFTWLLPKAKEICRHHKGRVVVGGPAVDLNAEYCEMRERHIDAETAKIRLPL